MARPCTSPSRRDIAEASLAAPKASLGNSMLSRARAMARSAAASNLPSSAALQMSRAVDAFSEASTQEPPTKCKSDSANSIAASPCLSPTTRKASHSFVAASRAVCNSPSRHCVAKTNLKASARPTTAPEASPSRRNASAASWAAVNACAPASSSKWPSATEHKSAARRCSSDKLLSSACEE